MAQVNQDAVDYSNEAQFRVVADTRCLIKKTTIVTVSGQQFYPLADDVIALRTLLADQVALPYLSVGDGLILLSLPADQRIDIVPSYFVIGRNLYFYPVPTDVATYTVYYEARPAPITSESSFEVSGDYERLIETLVQSMKLADDGQPEWAAAEQAFYDADMPRLRKRDRREQAGRVAVIGFDEVPT